MIKEHVFFQNITPSMENVFSLIIERSTLLIIEKSPNHDKATFIRKSIFFGRALWM